MKEYRFLKPGDFPEVFQRVRATLPDSYRDPAAFAQVYWAKTSAFFELGQMEGALWFVNLALGWKATIHVVLWGERLRHRVDDARVICFELMALFQLHKIDAYIPVANVAATKFVEKIGFRKEGVLAQWDRYDGKPVDIVVYSFMKEN